MSAKYLGDFAAGASVRTEFNTVNSSGVPTTLSSPLLVVLKDLAIVTPSGGVTITANADAVTGVNSVIVDTSIDTTTFAAGHDYILRLGASNVGGVSVAGAIICQFSIGARFDANFNALPLAQLVTNANITLMASDQFVGIDMTGWRVTLVDTIDTTKFGIGQEAYVSSFTSPNIQNFDRTLSIPGGSAANRYYYQLDPSVSLADGSITSSKFALGIINAAATGFLECMMLLKSRFFPLPGGSVSAPKSGNGNLIVKGAGGATIATQAVSDDGTNQNIGSAA